MCRYLSRYSTCRLGRGRKAWFVVSFHRACLIQHAARLYRDDCSTNGQLDHDGPHDAARKRGWQMQGKLDCSYCHSGRRGGKPRTVGSQYPAHQAASLGIITCSWPYAALIDDPCRRIVGKHRNGPRGGPVCCLCIPLAWSIQRAASTGRYIGAKVLFSHVPSLVGAGIGRPTDIRTHAHTQQTHQPRYSPYIHKGQKRGRRPIHAHAQQTNRSTTVWPRVWGELTACGPRTYEVFWGSRNGGRRMH